MAKVSPVSIKYLIHANFMAEGTLERPDVIGALFGQTEGLLGEDLEMRELQKEGKIGRIEVDLRKENKRTLGEIRIPTALDKSETTLIAAAIETIERMGPSDAQIEIERIEDVRGSKRDYIIERAKKLMKLVEGTTDSREISKTIKTSARTFELLEYGDEKLPCGNIDGEEIIVVEGRADVLNLLRAGIANVIGMNGTRLPEGIKKLGREKSLILFLDGDRGGKLIAKNVIDNTPVKAISFAPDGKEVEELQSKEILMNLRRSQTPEEFLEFERINGKRNYSSERENYEEKKTSKTLTEKDKDSLREIFKKNSGSGKAVFIDEELQLSKEVPINSLTSSIRRARKKPFALVIDGTVTKTLIGMLEDLEVRAVVAKNFSANSDKVEMLSA